MIEAKEGEPELLRCGVLSDGVEYYTEYNYLSNEIYVQKKNTGEYLKSFEELPKKLKAFTLSLYRYLRKAYVKDQPKWA